MNDCVPSIAEREELGDEGRSQAGNSGRGMGDQRTYSTKSRIEREKAGKVSFPPAVSSCDGCESQAPCWK